MGIPVLSFFSGGGFLDIGFEKAGFDIVWTNEFNSSIADMYEFAVTSWRQARDPTSPEAKIKNRKSIDELSAYQIIEEAFCGKRAELFGMIGGPPCTDFSVGGQNKGGSGEHGRLTKVYFDFIQDLKPDFFVMENVAGLWRTRKNREYLKPILDRLRNDSFAYSIGTRVLNSLEYGVPQNRERLFVVGFSARLLQRIYAEGGRLFSEISYRWPIPSYPDARSLTWPRMVPFGSSVEPPSGIPIELTVYPLLFDDPLPQSLPNGIEAFKPHSHRFWQIAEGDDSRKSFKRLHRFRYSPTAWYGNNEVHLHPSEPRRLSVREALRIQSVPDSYVLPKDYSLTAKFKLICNGVPYRLANCLAESITDFLGRI